MKSNERLTPNSNGNSQTLLEEPINTASLQLPQISTAEDRMRRINSNNNNYNGSDSINPSSTNTIPSQSTTTTTTTTTSQNTELTNNTAIPQPQGRTTLRETLQRHQNVGEEMNRQQRNVEHNMLPQPNNEVLNNIQQNMDQVIHNEQQVQADYARYDVAFGNLRAASTQLINDYVAFLAQQPLMGLLTSAMTLGGVYFAIRHGGGSLLRLLRGTANNLPGLPHQPGLPLTTVLPHALPPYFDDLGRAGGLAYLIRILGRFFRRL